MVWWNVGSSSREDDRGGGLRGDARATGPDYPWPCACRELRPSRLSRMAILVDDSVETILPIGPEAFALIELGRLRPAPQGHRGGE